MKGLFWGGNRLVGLRGFVTDPCGVGGSGIFGRQLESLSQTRLLVQGKNHSMALATRITYWFQREDAR